MTRNAVVIPHNTPAGTETRSGRRQMGHATLIPDRWAMESSMATFARVEQHSPQMTCEHANRC